MLSQPEGLCYLQKNDAEEVLGRRLQVWHMGKMGSILLVLLSKSTGGVLLMCFLPRCLTQLCVRCVSVIGVGQ